MIWWDGKDYDLPPLRDYFLPDVGVIKLVGAADDQPVVLAVTVGHTDGHHSHVEMASAALSITSTARA